MLSIQQRLRKQPSTRYAFSVCLVAASFVLRQVLTAYGGPGLPTYITFYPAVMFTAMVAGLWPGLLATALIVVGADYWILLPQGFGIESFTDIEGVVFFAGMGLSMSLAAEFYRRARKQVQESSLELKKANETLRHLSSRLLSAHEDERKRIAGEIHDTLGGCLAAIKFKLDRTQVQGNNNEGGATE